MTLRGGNEASTDLFINQFLEKDEEKIAELIRKNPRTVGISDAAKYVGVSEKMIRQFMDEHPIFGTRYKGENGRTVYAINTAMFVRWIMLKGV